EAVALDQRAQLVRSFAGARHQRSAAGHHDARLRYRVVRHEELSGEPDVRQIAAQRSPSRLRFRCRAGQHISAARSGFGRALHGGPLDGRERGSKRVAVGTTILPELARRGFAPPNLSRSMCQAARRPIASPPFGRPGLAEGRQANVSKWAQSTSSPTNLSRNSAATLAPAKALEWALFVSAMSDLSHSA